jgi:hypothetical protein
VIAGIENRDCSAAHARPRQWVHSVAVSAVSCPVGVYPRSRYSVPALPQFWHAMAAETRLGLAGGCGCGRGAAAGVGEGVAGAAPVLREGCQAGMAALVALRARWARFRHLAEQYVPSGPCTRTGIGSPQDGQFLGW